MSRPLICVVCMILLASSATYLSATTCSDSSKQADVSATAEVVCEGEETCLTICVSPVDKGTSGTDALKSSLLAGKTVGKAMVRTAVVLASSMARAARHAAFALVETAYSLV